MLLLIVWLVAAAVAVLVLGVLGYGLFGAVGRLLRELAGLQRDIAPVVGELQAGPGGGRERPIRPPRRVTSHPDHPTRRTR